MDILIIVDYISGKRRDLRIKIRAALREFLIAKDIMVFTTQDIEEWKDVPHSFVSKITRNGRIIYEKQN